MFSKIVKVSPRMLRYYEKNGLFFPEKIDKTSGYRLYSSRQIPLISKILAFRDMGFSVEEISEIIDQFEHIENLKDFLTNKREEVQLNIVEEEKKITRISNFLEKINSGNKSVNCSNVVLKSVPSTYALTLKEIVPDYSFQEQLWTKLFQFIQEENIYSLLEGTVVTIYYEEFDKVDGVEIEVGVVLKEEYLSKGDFTFKVLEETELVASIVGQGPYEYVLPEGELLLAKWIEENDFSIVGNERVFGIKHPFNEEDVSKYCTEIMFPIKNK